MDNLKRLYKYIKPYWGRVAIAFIFMAIFAAFNTLQFWIFKKIIDENFIARNLDTLPYILFLTFLIIFIKGISQYAQEYLMSRVGHSVVRDIRDSVYKHLHTLSLNFYTKRRTGDLMSHILNDISTIQNTIIVLVSDVIRQPMVLLGLTGYIFYLHWKLAFLCIVVYPLAIWPIIKFSQKLRRINARMQEKMSDITALLQEVFSSIPIVKAFSMEDYEVEKFYHEDRDYFNITMKTVKITTALPPLMELVGSIGFAMAVYYGAHEIFRGDMTTGDFLSFTAAVISFYRPARSLTQVNNNIQQAQASCSRIFSLIDIEPEIIEKVNAQDMLPVKNDIRFEGVNFSYENKEKILKNINLNVKIGQTIALVGPSGAGKTTLVNLLLRFYDPVSGRIVVDNIDIKDVTVKSLRSQIGTVTQETILFYDTVRNNISYGNREADFLRIIEAAKKANAHDFIEQLPKKYDTVIGERGVQLSGGQRQRLAIARAILKNPPILILDEATSALDTESERLVQSAIGNLMENRTTFVIAHRLSTILSADCIVVLDKGTIISTGRHEELLEKSSLYKRLYEMQFEEAG